MSFTFLARVTKTNRMIGEDTGASSHLGVHLEENNLLSPTINGGNCGEEMDV